MGQTGNVTTHKGVGARGLDAIKLLVHYRRRNGRHLDGEEASKTTALLVALEIDSIDVLQELVGLTLQSDPTQPMTRVVIGN